MPEEHPQKFYDEIGNDHHVTNQTSELCLRYNVGSTTLLFSSVDMCMLLQSSGNNKLTNIRDCQGGPLRLLLTIQKPSSICETAFPHNMNFHCSKAHQGKPHQHFDLSGERFIAEVRTLLLDNLEYVTFSYCFI